MWKWIDLFLRKIHLLRCLGCLSLLNWIGALTLSLSLKLPPRKLKPWFVLWSFFLLTLFLYLCKSTIRPFIEYCCHVLAGALSCYLELLNKFQKWICRTVGPSLAASLEHLSFFYMFYFGGFPLCYSSGRSTDYSYRLYDFSVTNPRCYKDVYVITQLDSGILCL